MLPIVYGLEKEYGDRIHFVRANILNPESKPVIEHYGFNATPEFYLVGQQGQIIAFWDESVTEEGLRQAFEAVLTDQ